MYFYDGNVSDMYFNDGKVSRIDGASITIISCLYVLIARRIHIANFRYVDYFQWI